MGATRDVALSELNFRGISINPETTENVVAITVAPSDSGVLFINKETSGTVTYTLPPVALGKGKMFWFYEGYATAIKLLITTSSIVGNNTTNAVASCTASVGSCGFVVGDGDYYYLFAIMGTWTVGGS